MARLLGVCRQQARAWCAAGDIHAWNVGRGNRSFWRARTEDVLAFKERRSSARRLAVAIEAQRLAAVPSRQWHPKPSTLAALGKVAI
jgi:hypothetical protein